MPVGSETGNMVDRFIDAPSSRCTLHCNMITDQAMTAQERKAVGSLALLYSFRMLGLFMVLPLLALYATDLSGATPALIGLALGLYGLTQAVFQIPFGWLSDRVGRKPVIVGGLLLFALGSVVAATADSIWGVILGRTLQGAGAIASTVMALVADLTSAEQRTKAMALVGMSIGASFALALVLGPVLASFGGLSAVFWATAALAVCGIYIVTALVPAQPAAGRGHHEAIAQRDLLGRSLRDGNLARLNLGVFVLHFVLMASFLLVPHYLVDVAAVAREQHWLVYLCTLLLSILGMVPLMAMGERGSRPRGAFLGGIGLVFAAVALILVVDSAWGLYGALWLFFVGFNYLEASLPSLVSKSVFEGGKGTAMGVYSTAQFLGAFAGGAAGGWLLQSAGGSALLSLCLAMLFVWGLVARGGGYPTSTATSPVDPIQTGQA